MLSRNARGISVPRIATRVVVSRPSGTSDMSGQIQKAIDRVNAAGGGDVILQRGTYTVNATLLLRDNVRLIGNGRNSTVIKAAASASLTSWAKTDLSSNWQTSHVATSSFPMKPVVGVEKGGSKKVGVAVESLTIDCNGSNQTDADSYCGLMVSNTDGFVGRDLHVKDAGLSISSIAASQRAYCYMCCDDDNTFFSNCTGDNSRYDVFSVRGWSRRGRAVNCRMGSTTGTSARASWQFAYQVSDWELIGCQGINDHSSSTSAHALLFHGVQRIKVIGGHYEASNASNTGNSGGYLFGDTTAGGDDSPTDGPGDTSAHPSGTLDEYTQQCVFDGVQFVSRSSGAVFNQDTDYVRDNRFIGCTFRHTSDANGVVLQAIGTTYTLAARRNSYIGCAFVQECSGTVNVGTIEYQDGIVFRDCVAFKQNRAGNVFAVNGCKNSLFDGMRVRVTPTSGGNLNTVFILAAKSGNPNSRVRFTNTHMLAGVTTAYGWYIDTATSGTHVTVERTNFGSGTFTHGIYFDDTGAGNATQHLFVLNNDFATATFATNGVFIDAAATPVRFVFTDNDLTLATFTTNKLNISGGSVGTGSRIERNRGYVTESVGTATVANGATTTGNVAHGLNAWRTLRVGDVLVTLTNSMGTATKGYVSSIDATNFVYTVDADPGATTCTISWQARANLP